MKQSARIFGLILLYLAGTVGAFGQTAERPNSLAVSTGASEQPTAKAQGGPQYLHILSAGQSLAAGVYSTPLISATQPYNNLSLSYSPSGFIAPLIPLREVDQEGPSSGLANTLHVLDPQARDVIIGLHAQSNKTYLELKKGTQAYGYGMNQVTASKSEVENLDSTATYLPIALTVVHGETDHYNGNDSLYQGYMEEWQSDYESDIRAIVGTNLNIPMFMSQMNTGWTGEMAVAQFQTHKANPGKIYLIGPKYQYTYYMDHLHLKNTESKHLGEMFAKVIDHVVIDGNPWSPLMPTAVHRYGNIILIDYHIPVGSLAIDTLNVKKRPHYGFEFVQTGGNAVSITDVALVNNNTQVQITLDSIPTGTNELIRYAYSCYRPGAGFARCGDATDSSAVGGNIRDTDASVSPAIGSTGLPLYDWSVAYEEPVLGPAGMEAAVLSPDIDIFPNPTHTTLGIRLRNSSQSIERLTLMDLSGKALKHWEVTGTDASVSVDDMPRGVYLLAVKVEGFVEMYRKVVLQ